MATSFSIVEEKTFEADYFLDKLKDCSGGQIREARFNLSAFISAARSVTFTIQKSLDGVDGFESWYKTQQDFLKNDQLADFFQNARRLSQHVGHYHINMGSFSKGKNEFFFHDFDNSYKYVPKDNIITASHKYFTILLNIIYDCFQTFGDIIDPDKYYTIEALKKRGQTVKELEFEIWGYPKWTSFNISEEETLKYILANMVKSPIDELFIKYLGKTKDGKIIKKIIRQQPTQDHKQKGH
jgi:hypothetical protein